MIIGYKPGGSFGPYYDPFAAGVGTMTGTPTSGSTPTVSLPGAPAPTVPLPSSPAPDAPSSAAPAAEFVTISGYTPTEPYYDPFAAGVGTYGGSPAPEPEPERDPYDITMPGRGTIGDALERNPPPQTEEQKRREEIFEEWIPYDWAADAERQRYADGLFLILEWLTVHAKNDPDFDPESYFAGSELEPYWLLVRNDPAVVAATQAAVAGAAKAAERRRTWSFKSRLEELVGRVQGHPGKIAATNAEMARLRAYIRKDLPTKPAGLAFIETAGNAAYDYIRRGGVIGLVIDKLSNNELPRGTRERTTWIVETYRRMWGVQPSAAELDFLDNGGHKDGLFGGKVPFASRASMTGLMLSRPPPDDFVPVTESVVPEVRKLLELGREAMTLQREFEDATKQLERLQLGTHEDADFQAWFIEINTPRPPSEDEQPAGDGKGGLLLLLAVAAKFAGFF